MLQSPYVLPVGVRSVAGYDAPGFENGYDGKERQPESAFCVGTLDGLAGLLEQVLGIRKVCGLPLSA
jgi:hypothetical protein